MNNLFKDKDGNLVEIHSVQLYRQGGGPVHSMSGEKFAETFEPAAMPGYRLVNVTGDWMPDAKVQAYWNGSFWNGWVTPMFTGESLVQLAAVMPEIVSFEGAEGGVLLILDQDAEGDNAWVEVEPEEILVDGQPVKVWYIDGWCWDLAE